MLLLLLTALDLLYKFVELGLHYHVEISQLLHWLLTWYPSL